MPDQPQPAPAPAPQPAAQPGPIGRLLGDVATRIDPALHDAEHDGAALVARIRGDVTGHASEAYSIAADMLAAASKADPADAKLLTQLLPRVLALASDAGRIASAALGAA